MTKEYLKIFIFTAMITACPLSYAGGGGDFYPNQQQFDHYVDVAQKQMAMPQQVPLPDPQGYKENEDVKEDIAKEIIDAIGTSIGYWWVLALVGAGGLTIFRKRIKIWLKKLLED